MIPGIAAAQMRQSSGGGFTRPVRVGTATAGVLASSTTLTLPAGAADGDLAVLVSMCNSSGTPTTPGAWSLVSTAYTAGSVVSRVHTKIVEAGETTVALSANTRCAWICIVIQSGTYDVATPIEAVTSNDRSATSATPNVLASTETYGDGAYLQLQIAGYDYSATPDGTTYPFAYGTYRAAGTSVFTNLVVSIGDFDGPGVTPSSTFTLPHSDAWQSRKFLIRGVSA